MNIVRALQPAGKLSVPVVDSVDGKSMSLRGSGLR